MSSVERPVPLPAVLPFADAVEAIGLANATKDRLTAHVWTADLAQGLRLTTGLH